MMRGRLVRDRCTCMLLFGIIVALGVEAAPPGDVPFHPPEWPVAAAEVLSGAKERDVDDDGRPERIVWLEEGRLVAVRDDGTMIEIPGTEPAAPDAGEPGGADREQKGLSYQPGWPIVTSGVFYSSPVLADIAGDEALEVICGCSDRRLYAWHEDGTPVEGWPVATDGEIRSSPAVGDIDGDGELEIIVGSWDHRVYAWNGDGTLVSGFWPREVNGVVKSSPAIGDVDQDGELEVVIASFWGPAVGSIYVFDGDGSDAPHWPKHLGEAMESSPALADIDNDSKLEIIIGTQLNRVYALNGENATLVAGEWPVTTSGQVRAAPSVGDIDHDGQLEIVVGDSWWGGHTWAFEADGTVMEGWPVDVDNNVIASPALVDFDCDGDLEIVQPTSIYVFSPVPCKVYLFHHDGTVVENWPVYLTGPFERTDSSPAVGNLDLDPDLEFVLGSAAGGVWSHLYAYDYDASLLSGFPLEGESIYASPALGDIDRDGRLELAIGSWRDQTMHCWEFDPGTFDPLGLPWPVFRHDSQHTGWQEYAGSPDASIEVVADRVTVAVGEIFGYSVRITNNTDGEWSGMGLVMLQLPGCVPYEDNPIVGPVAVALGPRQIMKAHFEQSVPVTAPPGTYTLIAALGHPPDRLISADRVVIEVLQSREEKIGSSRFPRTRDLEEGEGSIDER